MPRSTPPAPAVTFDAAHAAPLQARHIVYAHLLGLGFGAAALVGATLAACLLLRAL